MKTLLEYINESLLIEAEDETSEDEKSNDENPEDSNADESTKERADIKFTIWKEPDTKIDWLEGDEPFQKIEYIYSNKEKNICIDFLLGRKNNVWQLWAGKDGAVNYDDDPFYDLEENTFAKAIVAALDKVQETIKDVKDNPDNWAQFYLN